MSSLPGFSFQFNRCSFHRFVLPFIHHSPLETRKCAASKVEWHIVCMVQERIYIKCENQQAIRVENEKMSNDLLSTEDLMRFLLNDEIDTPTPSIRIHLLPPQI